MAFLVWAAASPARAAEFESAAAEAYRRELAALAARGALDADAALLESVRRVSRRLILAAADIHPGSATWEWEVHVTVDPSTAAFCMPGGKILVGSAFVHRLALDDGELAMLLAHEMAHALAGHRRERTLASNPDADPAGEVLATARALAQEDEADRIGIGLALRAGWPPQALVAFFDKLAAGEPAGSFSTTHAASRVRAGRAREYAGIAPSPPPR